MAPVLQALLADADSATRNALTLLLKSKLGLVAIGAAVDGETLTRAIAECQPSLVLLDWSLPGRPSPDRLIEMQRANPNLHLVILSVDSANAADAEAVGAVFVHKGSAAEQVLEQLRRIAPMTP
jgi:two-component system, NarL family, invasion response regulator UvrY